MIKKTRGSGFSLAEILIATAIIGTLSLALMKMIKASLSSQKGVQNSADFENLKTVVKMIIAKPALCSTGLLTSSGQPIQFNPAATPPITPDHLLNKFVLGTSLVTEVGQKLSGGLQITKIELRDTGVTPEVNATEGTTTYIVELVIEGSKGKDAFGGALVSNARNPFHLKIKTTTSTNVMVDCGEELDPVDPGSSPTCPANTSPVDAGPSSFCIDTTQRPKLEWIDAATACNDLGGQLCNGLQYNIACVNRGLLEPPITDMLGDWEWLADRSTGNAALRAGKNNCLANDGQGSGTDSVYRCCYNPFAVSPGTCDPGMSKIVSVCIDTATRSADTFANAMADCTSSGAQLCADSQWTKACNGKTTAAPPLVIGAGEEWVNYSVPFGSKRTRGNGYCSSLHSRSSGSNYPYRCCKKVVF